MVEVFKTNVETVSHADAIIALLEQCFPGSRVNFDLDDCDRVLRIEGKDVKAGNIIKLVAERGYDCCPLE